MEQAAHVLQGVPEQRGLGCYRQGQVAILKSQLVAPEGFQDRALDEKGGKVFEIAFVRPVAGAGE